MVDGQHVIMPLNQLGKMLAEVKIEGRRESSESSRQYARRYEVLRDLQAYGSEQQPLRLNRFGDVKVLQGDLLDQFVDEVIRNNADA